MRISIHSPLAGRDGSIMRYFPGGIEISIHSPLAGRDGVEPGAGIDQGISIHSPLAGRDCPPSPARRCRSYFNPLAPRGARLCAAFVTTKSIGFQSTRPSRGETYNQSGAMGQAQRISIHSPLAGRDQVEQAPVQPGGISIHSPLAGRDGYGTGYAANHPNFNPLAPRGARRRRNALCAREL